MVTLTTTISNCAFRYSITNKVKTLANTYTQIHLHVVFAVKFRAHVIQKDWKDELYRYITGIIQNYDHKVLQINGMPDHVHILIGMRPAQSLSELMKAIKQHSSKWINNKRFVNGTFAWQAGYGAFSYSKQDLPKIINYIKNQEEHHKNKTFREEYLAFLKAFQIDYNESYIFKTLE